VVSEHAFVDVSSCHQWVHFHVILLYNFEVHDFLSRDEMDTANKIYECICYEIYLF
jgi:hypothetical protein